MFNITRFYLRPFKDVAYIVFDIDSLNELKRIYMTTGPYPDVESKLSGLGTNHHYIPLTRFGYGPCHIFYLPIVGRQQVGQEWNYMLGALNKMAISATFNCASAAGYDPVKQSAMFVELANRVLDRLVRQVTEQLNGHLTIGSRASLDIDRALGVDGLSYIDTLEPQTLSDLARTQIMVENNGVAEYTGNLWSATTYFY